MSTRRLPATHAARLRRSRQSPSGDRPASQRSTDGLRGGAASDVALQLAISKGGLGIELARPVLLECLHVTDIASALAGLRFPVDVTGGVSRFRHRRGELQRLQLELPVRNLETWLAPRLRGILGTRTPEVSVGSEAAAATICLFDGARAEEEPLRRPTVLAFELHVLPENDDLAFVIDGARGSELPGPATALAIACVETAFAGAAHRDGAMFVLRRAAETCVRAILPEAGARAPSSVEVRWASIASHGDTWILNAARGAMAAAPTPAALRARETARMLREADDALVRGSLQDARTKYIEALERAPRNPEIAMRVVDIDARAGGRAEAALAMLAESRAETARTGTTLGELLAETGDVEAAIASLERTGEMDPAAAVGASAFEFAARLSRDPVDAAGWLDRALARTPRSTSARWMRVVRRLQLGRLEDALADAEYLEALVQGVPGRHAVWVHAGRAWQGAGLGARAGPIYERALRYVPDEPRALAGLGVALIGGGQEVRGTMLLSRAAQIAESRGEPTAYILLDLGKAIAEALDDLPAAIARVASIPLQAPEAPFARGLEGRWRARLGDLAGAALAFARVRELGASLPAGSEDERAQPIAAFLVEGAEMERSRRGDPLAAQRHLAVALRLRPHDPRIREAYREVGDIIARGIPEETPLEDLATQHRPLPMVDLALSSENYSVEDAAKATRVEELTRRLQASPGDDRTAEELIALLETLGRGHELLALVSARLEDASQEQREALAPRARAALDRLACEAESAGHADEAALYRQAIERL